MMIPIPKVKNIIFDLGGVILNIDYHATERAFVHLGIKDFRSIYSQFKQNLVFDQIEKGEISPDEFRAAISEHLPGGTSHAQIDKAWNAMLLDLPPARLQLLKTLKSKYRTFLLSNTNKIHYDQYSAGLYKHFGIYDFSDILEKQYFSFMVGMKKPDLEIFDLVIQENNLVPEETLFIDDTEQHIQGAQKAGLQTFHLTNNDLLELDF